MKKYKVFVYGTLKKGFHNHHLLEGHEGKDAIALGIELYEGPGIPFAKEGDGKIMGELYEVDCNSLEKLDQLEGHPFFYCRKLKAIECEGKKQKAYIYIYDKIKPENKILSGVWNGKRIN